MDTASQPMDTASLWIQPMDTVYGYCPGECGHIAGVTQQECEYNAVDTAPGVVGYTEECTLIIWTVDCMECTLLIWTVDFMECTLIIWTVIIWTV